jgi:hypothetical protein
MKVDKELSFTQQAKRYIIGRQPIKVAANASFILPYLLSNIDQIK